MTLLRRRMIGLLALAAALGGGAYLILPYAIGAAIVIDAGGLGGLWGRAAGWTERSLSHDDVLVPWRGGSLTGRLYVPAGEIRRALLLVPGVHAAGIDEPRLHGFATDLGARGFAVLTAELPDLRAYAITPRTTDMIEDAALWLASRPELARDGRVGLMGISFGGGLGVVAAGRPGLRDKVSLVFSLGGHGDLPRTLRYLCTGRLPDGSFLPPHDYGVVIVLLGVIGRVVPADQAGILERGLRLFLEASHADLVDRARAAALFARAIELASTMPEPAATLMRHVNNRDVAALGPILLPHVNALGGDPALSPERSASPRAPVFLLHGADDNVIPAAESVMLARHLEPSTRVRLLVTPLISHAELGDPTDVRAVWRLVSFWTDVIDE